MSIQMTHGCLDHWEQSMNWYRETWTEQCEAASEIREDFGIDKALGYLIGEKFINAIGDSTRYPEIAQDLPAFATEIRSVFALEELQQWFATTRRIGALGHAMSDEEFEVFRDAGAVDEDVARCAAQVIAFERARELLLGPGQLPAIPI